MTRHSLSRLFKTTLLAFAISTTIIPSAAAMRVSAEGGAGATSTPSLNGGDGWYTSAIQSIVTAGADDRAIPFGTLPATRATESPFASPDDRPHPRIAPTTQTPVQVVSRPDGFSWGDAGIGAAGGLVVALLLAGMALVAVRQRDLPLAPR